MAANGGDPGRAGALLGVYSLGLGVPFLLTTLLLDRVQGILRNMQRHMRKIELVSGAFLVLIGIAVASGELQSLSATFASDQFAQAATDLESSVIERLTGQSVEDGAETVDAVENSGLTFIEPGTIYSSENAIDGIGASLSSPLNTIEEAAQTVDGF
jgi:hypothetical protein